MDLKEYDGVEVRACTEHPGGLIDSYIRDADVPEDQEISFWGVYLKYKGKEDTICVADCYEFGLAEFIADALYERWFKA